MLERYYGDFNYNPDAKKLSKILIKFIVENIDTITDIAFVIRHNKIEECDPYGNKCNISRGISTTDEEETATFKTMFGNMCDIVSMNL